MTPRRALTDSPFDTLEKTFDLLVTGPRPLALDTTPIAGLPNRAVPLGELKGRLLHPSTPFSVRDAIVDQLVARSQAHGGAWTVGARRGAPPRPTPGRLAARAGLPGQGRRHRGRDPRRVLGRRRRLPARPGSPGVTAVLAGPYRRPAAAASRAVRAGPSGHRSRLGRPAPAVGPPRPGAGQSGSRRGDRGGRRRADRGHPPRRRRPGRRRQRARHHLQGLPSPSVSGRIEAGRVPRIRPIFLARFC